MGLQPYRPGVPGSVRTQSTILAGYSTSQNLVFSAPGSPEFPSLLSHSENFRFSPPSCGLFVALPMLKLPCADLSKPVART